MSTFTEPMLKADSLAGKSIIITGGGTGLGKAMATYFSQLGADITITSRKEEVVRSTAEEISDLSGRKVLAVAGDVRKTHDARNVLAQAVSTFGKVDSLVNNAAGNFVSPTERLSHRAFEAVLGIVLTGSINYSMICGKYWIQHKIKGSMLNIVTTYAWTGTGYTVPSACAKAGVLALTRSLAVEWGSKYGIRANAIAPGPFPTQGAWTRLFPENMRDQLSPKDRVPLGRTGHPQELANLAAYLVSDFSAYVNGEVITIDGGEWLRGAGQFNSFEIVPEEMWDQWEKMRKKAD